MSRRILTFELVLIVAALVAAIVAYPHLPAQIATHWGTQMQADGYSGRVAIFWLGPGLMLAIVLFARFGPWLSPARYNVSSFDPTWQRLMLIVFCLITVLFGVMLWSALGHTLNAGRVLAGAFCLFVIFFGNLLSKVRPNFFLGIRTPWTLASEHVWIATHRLAAWTTVLSGICGFALILVGRPQWFLLPFVFAILLSAGYSLVLYKQTVPRDQKPSAQR
jgi:uncharacterized membrane protein